MRTILISLLSFLFLFADSHHISSKTVIAGEKATLNLTLENTFNVKGVYLHYRTNIAEEYKTIQMNNFGFEYSYDLMIPAENTTNLEYYFSVVDRQGRIKTNPVNNAYNKPYVSQIVDYKKQTAVDYLIISPEENEEVAQEDFMISITLLEVPPKFNIKNTKVLYDGRDVTKFVDFDEDLISWVPVDVTLFKQGPHNIDVIFYDNTENEVSKASWNFKIVSNEEGTQSLGGSTYSSYSGSFSLNNRNESYGNSTSTTDGENYLTTNLILNGKYGPLDLRLTNKTSSEQRDDRQNINRFFVGLTYEPFEDIYIRTNFGDVSPRYNTQMFNFENMRGYNAGLYLGVFNFQYAQGINKKSIFLDKVAVNDSTTTADPNSSFEREFKMGRFSIGNKDRDGFSLGFNFLKSADKTLTNPDSAARSEEYTHYGYTPSENLVVGADFLLGMFQNRIRFTTGVFGSVTMDDVSTGNLAFEDLKEFAGDDIDSFESYYDQATKIITISGVPNFGLTYYTSFDFNYWDNFIKVRYDYVNAEFHSEGNPFLINDMARLTYFHSYRLLDNQLYLNFNLKSQNNNLNDSKDFNTTTISDISAGFTFYPKFDFPNLSVMFTKNDQEDIDSLDALQSSVNNTNVTATMSYTMDIVGVQSNMSLIFGSGSGSGKSLLGVNPTEATTDEALSASTTNFALTGAFNYPGLPLRIFGEISSFESVAGEDEAGITNISTTNGFRTSGTYDIFTSESSGTLGAFGELSFNATKTEGDGFGYNDISQQSISFGGSYKYNLTQTISTNSFLRFKNVSLSGEDETYSNRYITFSTNINF